MGPGPICGGGWPWFTGTGPPDIGLEATTAGTPGGPATTGAKLAFWSWTLLGGTLGGGCDMSITAIWPGTGTGMFGKGCRMSTSCVVTFGGGAQNGLGDCNGGTMHDSVLPSDHWPVSIAAEPGVQVRGGFQSSKEATVVDGVDGRGAELLVGGCRMSTSCVMLGGVRQFVSESDIVVPLIMVGMLLIAWSFRPADLVGGGRQSITGSTSFSSANRLRSWVPFPCQSESSDVGFSPEEESCLLSVLLAAAVCCSAQSRAA